MLNVYVQSKTFMGCGDSYVNSKIKMMEYMFAVYMYIIDKWLFYNNIIYKCIYQTYTRCIVK